MDAQREFRLKTEHPRVGRGKLFEQERYNLRCNVRAYIYVTAESLAAYWEINCLLASL